MTSQAEPSLGVLLLERGVQPVQLNPTPFAGSLTNPATFNFPVISETVEGAWVENVVRGAPGALYRSRSSRPARQWRH